MKLVSTSSPTSKSTSNSALSSTEALEGISCAEVIELQPWLLNNSLEADERQEVLSHLKACQTCKAALAETMQAAELLTQHVPSLTLVEYAQGLPSSEMDHAQIERHLECCSSCRQEVDWIMAEEVLDFQAARQRLADVETPERDLPSQFQSTPGHGWAIAATVTLVLGAGALLFTDRSEEPRAETMASVAPLETGGSPSLNATAVFSDGFELGNTAKWSSTNTESH